MMGREVDIGALSCATKVTGDVQSKPELDCVGINKAIGFNVPRPINKFIDLFYSCIHSTDGSVLYTRYTLYGTEINCKLHNYTLIIRNSYSFNS